MNGRILSPLPKAVLVRFDGGWRIGDLPNGVYPVTASTVNWFLEPKSRMPWRSPKIKRFQVVDGVGCTHMAGYS